MLRYDRWACFPAGCDRKTRSTSISKSQMSELDKDRIREKIQDLRTEHRDLDEAILRLTTGGGVPDMLALQRMKKRKLVIKDMLIKLESMLLDDIIA